VEDPAASELLRQPVQLVHDAVADELLVGERVLDAYIDLLEHSLPIMNCDA